MDLFLFETLVGAIKACIAIVEIQRTRFQIEPFLSKFTREGDELFRQDKFNLAVARNNLLFVRRIEIIDFQVHHAGTIRGDYVFSESRITKHKACNSDKRS